MSAYVRSQNVLGWAGLWMRIDQENPYKAVSFDNMHDRAIIANTPWTKYNIVLDVPENATDIIYGGMLVDGGQIWMDDFSFEVVSDTVKVTGYLNAGKNSKIVSEPANTDFDKK